VEELDVTNPALFDQLYQMNVIDTHDIEDLQSETTTARKVERLLSLLSRMSPRQFEQFIAALYETGQQELAKALRNEDGGMFSAILSL
jgi:Caspase recruitment domain